jgi:hypothetical protein
VAYPGFLLFGGGGVGGGGCSTSSAETQGRKNGDLGTVAP